MLDRSSEPRLPAPCIIETGILVNKRDMLCLLGDLTQVRYIDIQDGQPQHQGEAYVIEVFIDPTRSTMLANRSLYLNLASFDYLELKKDETSQLTHFELVQDTRCLQLVPLCLPNGDRSERHVNDETLESMLVRVISAKLDAQIDDLDDWNVSDDTI